MSLSMNVNFINPTVLKPEHKKDCILLVQSMLNPETTYVCLGFYSKTSECFYNADTNNRLSDNVVLWVYESDIIPKDIRRQPGYLNSKCQAVENFRRDFTRNSIRLQGV